jgi:hypothetical protein
MAVFWVVAPCRLVEVCRCLEVLSATIIRAVECHRDTRCLENLRSHSEKILQSNVADSIRVTP